MNQAEALLRSMFGFEQPTGPTDVFEAGTTPNNAAQGPAVFHPEVRHSLFGPSGTKEQLAGRDAFFAFVARCSDALADRSDEIIAIRGIDEQCALVHARAWRKSKASGEEIRYEWAMLYRVENGQITYGTDMLDADAQAFWGRVLQD